MGVQLSNQGVDVNARTSLKITAGNPSITLRSQSAQCPLDPLPIVLVPLLRWIREAHVSSFTTPITMSQYSRSRESLPGRIVPRFIGRGLGRGTHGVTMARSHDVTIGELRNTVDGMLLFG
jgi:hypothetical protein